MHCSLLVLHLIRILYRRVRASVRPFDLNRDNIAGISGACAGA